MKLNPLLKTFVLTALFCTALTAEELDAAAKCDVAYTACTEKCDQAEDGSSECYEKCEDTYSKCLTLAQDQE